MNFIIESKLKECNKSINSNTLRTYVSNINTLMSMFESSDLSILYKDYENIIKLIKKEYKTDNSQRNKFTACNAIIRCLIIDENRKEIVKAIEMYTKEISILREKIDAYLDTHIKSEKEEEGWLSIKEEKKLTKKLYERIPDEIEDLNDLSLLRDYVLFVFYQNMPSRNDIVYAKFLYYDEVEDIDKLSKDKELNYIILKKEEKKVLYIMNNYKTSKKYKSQTLELDNILYDILENYKDKMKPFNDDDWFILSNKGKKISKETLTLIYSKLGNVIGKKLSIRTNRHIQVSNKIDIVKMEKLAKMMGHDISIAFHNYAKKTKK